MTLTLAATFASSVLITWAATPAAAATARRFGIVDMPAARKVHTQPVPYLGGVAIVLGFCATVLVGFFAIDRGGATKHVVAIIGGALLLFVMGLVDDLRVVPGWVKVPTELALGVLLWFSGSGVSLFGIAVIDLIVTVAWVIGVTNAINYLDNMDGLSAGVVAITAGFFLFLSALSGQVLVAGLAAAVAGCALGFLWHNRPPAKVFMGDAGSLFFGFLLAALGLELQFDNIARVTFLVPVAILAVPVLDALLVSYSRVRRGLSPIAPGRDHISHRLVKMGFKPHVAVGLVYFVSAACGWLGVVIAYSPPLTAYMLMGWMIATALLAAILLLRVEV